MKILIGKKEFKKINADFRRVSSDLLNSQDIDEALRLLKIFLNYIDNQPLIKDFILKNEVVTYDMKTVINQRPYMEIFQLPLDKSEEISYIYQLLKYVAQNNRDYRGLCDGYSDTYSSSVLKFNSMVTKRLYTSIADYLGGIAIDMEYDQNSNSGIKIEGNVGQLNFAQTGGVVNAVQDNNSEMDLMRLSQELVRLLKESNLPEEEKEEAIDLVETATDQIESQKPKRGILKATSEKLSYINTIAGDGTSLAEHAKKFMDILGIG
ncbi:hypothetical protein [Paenibacillus sp. UNC499MF]|uniref:hypothetical protein n=1 Tax=Paenibacillus sp. UNC499MF TaxID=1502751 RepID=UPI0008A05991|nr:hypothetical protein [Paenibacillus sp. UNC499MF]SEG45329.1 hypothetical protein SAMN02799616_03037 [Paenibacillus sp. UNC499MF]